METQNSFEQNASITVIVRDEFPLETLPSPVRHYVEEAAASLPVDPVMVALPCLVTIGAAIGNTRSVRIKQGWIESASLYAAIVADAGSMKSPSLAMATDPLKMLQKDGTRRTWTSDTTVEALGVVLQENPRGIVVIHDELSSWVLSMNQYKKAGTGSDKQFYLSVWGGTSTVVDRKMPGPNGLKFIQIDKPFVSVIGAIPPEVLAALRDDLRLQDGFVHRVLFALPEPVPVRLTDQVVADGTKSQYAELVKQLSEIDWPSEPYPAPLDLTPPAYLRFQAWHDSLMAEMEQDGFPDYLKGFWAKLKGYCGRLALIHAVASDPSAESISEESVTAAIKQIEYFKGQAIKIADRIGLSVGTDKEGKLIRCKEFIIRKVIEKAHIEPLKRRNIQKLSNDCGDGLFSKAWDSLIGPELIISHDGTVSLSPTSIHRQTDSPVYLNIVSTDRPTNDVGEPSQEADLDEDIEATDEASVVATLGGRQ